jgi:hypothetical protein
MSDVGHKAKVYYATDDDIEGTPTWTLLSIVEEATPSEELSVGEVKNRASDEVKVADALFTRQGELRLTHSPGDAGYEAFRDAFHNKTDIAIAIMDGPIATVGSEGLQMDVKVTSWSRSEPLEEVMGIDFTVRPSAAAATTSAWVEISA